MKTLILYATKYGATRIIAEALAKEFSEVTVFDLKGGQVPPISQYDCIIVGSSLYAGKIRKEAKTFLSQNSEGFPGKKLGLFLSGLNAEVASSYFTDNIPGKLLQQATATVFTGGILHLKKCNFFERLVIKAIVKQDDYVDTIAHEKITHFAEVLKQ